MGTSKGYIAPTKPEWSASKRAISAYLRNRDYESKKVAMEKYVTALASTGGTASKSFSMAAGKVLNFASYFSENNLNDTLIKFGRKDLIGRNPDEIMDILLNQFTNKSSTLEDSLCKDAISIALENLEIEDISDLKKIDLDILLNEMVIEFIKINFDLRYDEKIGKGRSLTKKKEIVKEMHEYIHDSIYVNLNPKKINNINFSKLNSSKIVKDTLDEAYKTFQVCYGGE